MLREIRKKLVVLEGRKPFKEKVRIYLDKTEQIDWIYMNMRLDGSDLSREDVSTILNGDCILTMTIHDHLMISILEELRKNIHRSQDLQEELSRESLERMYSIISRTDLKEIIFTEKENKELRAMFRWLYHDDKIMDVLKRATVLHYKILRIFDRLDEKHLLARAAMFFYIIQKGLPICNLTLSEAEYNGGKPEELYSNLVRCQYNRLEIMERLTEI